MEDTDANEPRYKLCTFLFGNVDRRGRLEGEYAKDVELSSINNIDTCHVTEVESSIRTIVSNAAEGSSPASNDSGDATADSGPLAEAKDYYDESEVIHLDSIENALPVPFNEDDDYDEITEVVKPAATVEVLEASNSPSKIKHLFSSSSSSPLGSPRSQPSPTLSGTHPVIRCCSEPSSPTPKQPPAANQSGEQQTSVAQTGNEASVMMPPPLHPAPIANTSPLNKPVSCNDDDALLSNDHHLSTHRVLNTPLGNLLPPEYADVDITSLFPHYSPDSIPRWGRILNLPYPPRKYENLKCESSKHPLEGESGDNFVSLTNGNANSWSEAEDRLHLIFRNYLDLGEVPTKQEQFDQAAQIDEMRELEQPPEPGQNYLAGAERSWWQVAFAERLAEIENATSDLTNKACTKGKDSEGKKDKKSKKKSPETATTAGLDDKTNADDNDVSNSPQSRYWQVLITWRFGPAKYWYDQLEIPETADITKWTDWCKNPAVVAPLQTDTHSKPPETAATLADDSESAENKVGTKSSQLASTEDSGKSDTNDSEVVANGEHQGAQQSAAMQVDEEDTTDDEPDEDEEDRPEEEVFLPYQLMQWEDDIIYDPQLSSYKVTVSARQNAAYAGWIPSQHCRTMAAFQDMYQGKYPGILGFKTLVGSGVSGQSTTALSATTTTATTTTTSTSLEGSNQPPTALRSSSAASAVPSFTGPYAFFPVENARILDDSWRFDIIYDPQEQAAAATPFLLTLDKNDERCVLDPVVNDNEVVAVATPMTLSNKQHMQEGSQSQVNRASFHVTFGFASTRGTLTGALAKAEKGAEKVKRILGKHGFLAEGEWNDESPVSEENAEGGDEHQEATNMASVAAAASGLPPKDPLNLSNDEFYAIRPGGLFGTLARCGPLQHSTPAVELWPPFFPTYNTPLRLRQFHRVPLKQYTRGVMSHYGSPISVSNLTKNIQKKAKEREEEKMAAGGGDIFFMRTPQDLSGFDGELVLFEYSEEFPPLMNQIGMATRLVNYYRPLLPKDPSLSPDPAGNNSPPDLPYGSLVNVGSTDSPFLGASMENNMFRAPIYPHKTPTTDFVVIRNRNGLWIRRVPNAFTVGQEVPLMEVPGPNSKRANNFARDFLQVYILRLFLKSTDEPKRIKMEEIRSAFPNHSESSVRKRLKICADFKRTGKLLKRMPVILKAEVGVDASWWVLRPDYRLPSEEEIRYLVQPEDFCAFFSMQAAELRLKDAGYGEKSLFVLDENPEEEEEKEGQPKMEDEVRAAPWNTTRAYLAAQRGGCFLELHGPADPTGCGEAFSYSKTSAKPGALFRQAGGEVARGLLKDKKTVTGTDADLRKLHLREARALLRSFGISEADLKTFKRWEIIDMVRFTSTERAKQGEEESTAKFARGNRLSMAEQIRCYREECQRIFDLQNRVLSNPELLSSDEEEEEPSSEEEEDDEAATSKNASAVGGGTTSNAIGGVRLSSLPSSNHQSARNVQSLLANRITSEELRERQEEVEREDLKRSVELGKSLSSSTKNRRKQNQQQPHTSEAQSTSQTVPQQPAAPVVYDANATSAGTILDCPAPFTNAQKKVLRIVRTFGEGTDRQYTRVELVPWSPVIEVYLKIKQTKDVEQIYTFVGSDEQFKEQKRKEKRRIQDQLRRVRKQQELLRARGLAGGGVPLRDASGRLLPANRLPFSSSSASSSSRRRHKPTSNILKMRCGACGQTAPPVPGGRGAARRLLPPGVEPEAVAAAQELTSKPVAELLAASGGGGGGAGVDSGDTAVADTLGDGPRSIGASRLSDDSDDVFDRPHYARGDDYYEGLDEDSSMERPRFFENTRFKSNTSASRYLDSHVPPKRHDLKMTISKQLLDRLDAATEVVRYVEAVNQRGRGAGSTGGARFGAAGGSRKRSALASAADDDYPTSTIKHRGNRRRIDPRVAINHIFEGIYKGLSQIPGYKIFLHPVKEKDFPNYYTQIKTPMDLSQIRMKINENAYSTREEFLSDIRLIHDNSEKFNGRFSSYTETAKKMCSYVAEEFCQKEMKLMRLEPLVNPLLDENDLVRLGFLLQKAVDAMRGVENSRAFHFPVEKRRYPDYYKAISHPMDLSTLEKLIKENRYHSREEFFADADLILSNCRRYNGDESVLTKIAHKMLDVAHSTLNEVEDTIETIEENIRQRLDDISIPDSQSQHGGIGSVDLTGPSSSKPTKQPPKQLTGDLEASSNNQGSLRRPREDDTESVSSAKRPKIAAADEEVFPRTTFHSPRSGSRHEEEEEEEEEEEAEDEDGEFHYDTEPESRFYNLLGADFENAMDHSRHPPISAEQASSVDEDTRYSVDEKSVVNNAQDTLVAHALQLTSSESNDSPSEREGGELMSDSMVGGAEMSQPASHYSPDLGSDQANDGFDSQPEGTIVEDEGDEDACASERHRVEFFIGSDDEDEDSQQ
ncbi:unnamed protein product [Mesocestoides corti]|uniref:Bromo domain-containing protein n=1 Tax=Mesocestoides corti TaxID=53468 RepID=A0A158QU09_MESCO|nr:unnamed protein product [Mesocestoides corti]